MHIGSYDDEPTTACLMHQHIENLGYELDMNNTRYHHEIYLSNPRKQSASNLRNIIFNILLINIYNCKDF